ncbi:TPA: acyltransferase family protein [Acinetobacter baumannii]|nr:acyltransferase family protein [Acinetobacter baumannii]HCW5686275.1 acyltransferase family protein [Acinetobacter baumannii]HCW5714061.1 acyltransferase family protein [Acinetobacter baumannii]HCW5729041.1 acyltransferase family protein [Acinetobacter baumannii]
MTRSVSIDVLKVILALFVIALHSKIFIDFNDILYFFSVNGIFRIAVPVFLVITGYYFYLVTNFGAWLKRVAFLYIIWMFFYGLFYIDFSLSVYALLKNIYFILFGYHHLWYLIGTVFGGILLFYLKDSNVKFQFFLAILFFTLGCIVQYLGNFHLFNSKWDMVLNANPIYRNFLTVCYPFLTFCYLIHKFNLTAKYKKIAPFAVIISLILLYVEVYINYFFISKTDPLDLMFFLMLLCPSLFIFVFNLNIEGQGKKLALFSTALYLIHPLFQNLLKSFNINSIELFLVTVVLSCLASIVLIMLNKKIKVIL